MVLRQAILTELARRPMTGYELARRFDQVYSFFWSAPHQQIYRELAKLHNDQCVCFELVPQEGKPDKKLYSMTDAGRQELQQWAAQPCAPPRPKFELMVKLLAGTLVNPPALPLEIERVWSETDAILEEARRMEQQCVKHPVEALSKYDQMLYLGLRRGLLMLEAQQTWLQEVREYLETGTLKS